MCFEVSYVCKGNLARLTRILLCERVGFYVKRLPYLSGVFTLAWVRKCKDLMGMVANIGRESYSVIR